MLPSPRPAGWPAAHLICRGGHVQAEGHQGPGCHENLPWAPHPCSTATASCTRAHSRQAALIPGPPCSSRPAPSPLRRLNACPPFACLRGLSAGGCRRFQAVPRGRHHQQRLGSDRLAQVPAHAQGDGRGRGMAACPPPSTGDAAHSLAACQAMAGAVQPDAHSRPLPPVPLRVLGRRLRVRASHAPFVSRQLPLPQLSVLPLGGDSSRRRRLFRPAARSS